MTWRDCVACLNEDPELFFAVGNTGPALDQIEQAKSVCRRCGSLRPVEVGHRVPPGRGSLGRAERDDDKVHVHKCGELVEKLWRLLG